MLNLAFVSPNTKEGSTVQDALRDEVGKDLVAKEGGKLGLGFWRDGAEVSGVFHAPDSKSLLSLAATLGSRWRQKAILAFTEHPHGDGELHTLLVPGEPEVRDIDSSLLNEAGVEYKTLVPTPRGLLVHVIDPDRQQGESLSKWARVHGARMRTHVGRVHFIGAEDREGAQGEFAKVLGQTKLARKSKVPPTSDLAKHAAAVIDNPSDNQGWAILADRVLEENPNHPHAQLLHEWVQGKHNIKNLHNDPRLNKKEAKFVPYQNGMDDPTGWGIGLAEHHGPFNRGTPPGHSMALVTHTEEPGVWQIIDRNPRPTNLRQNPYRPTGKTLSSDRVAQYVMNHDGIRGLLYLLLGARTASGATKDEQVFHNVRKGTENFNFTKQLKRKRLARVKPNPHGTYLRDIRPHFDASPKMSSAKTVAQDMLHDFLLEHEDPRAELVAKRMGAIAALRDAQGSVDEQGRYSDRRVRPQASRSHTTIKWRNPFGLDEPMSLPDPVRHQFSDGSSLTINAFAPWQGNATTGGKFLLHWQGVGQKGGYRTTMTPEEFKGWVSRFHEEERPGMEKLLDHFHIKRYYPEEPTQLARLAYRQDSPGAALASSYTVNAEKRKQIAESIIREAGLNPAVVRNVLTHEEGRGTRASVLTVIKRSISPELAKYVASWFGLLAREKQLTVFHPGIAGEDRLHVLSSSLPVDQMGKVLSDSGVPRFTLEEHPRGSRAYVFSPGGSLDAHVARVIGGTNASHSSFNGTGFRLGASAGTDADSRAKYRATISGFESSTGS